MPKSEKKPKAETTRKTKKVTTPSPEAGIVSPQIISVEGLDHDQIAALCKGKGNVLVLEDIFKTVRRHGPIALIARGLASGLDDGAVAEIRTKDELSYRTFTKVIKFPASVIVTLES